MFGIGKRSRKTQSSGTEDVLVNDVPALYLAQPLCIWVNNAEKVLCPKEYVAIHNTLPMDIYKRQQLILRFQMFEKKAVPFSPLTGVQDSGNYLLNNEESWDLLIPYIEFLLKEIREISDPFKTESVSIRINKDDTNDTRGTYHPAVSQIFNDRTSVQARDCNDLVISLDKILKEGSSKWTVSRDVENTGLIERIDPEQQQMIHRVLSKNDNASNFLAEAYEKIFGRNPNYTDGYEDLIKAVETLSHPLISPKSTRASLSQDANCMRDQDDWHYVIEPQKDRDKVHGGMLRPLMHALMNNDHSRHGSDEMPQQNSEEEAKGGFFVALLLVEAFRDGYILKG